jgi:hypothetical protein
MRADYEKKIAEISAFRSLDSADHATWEAAEPRK